MLIADFPTTHPLNPGVETGVASRCRPRVALNCGKLELLRRHRGWSFPTKAAVPQQPDPRRCKRTCERPCTTRSCGPAYRTELSCKAAGSGLPVPSFYREFRMYRKRCGLLGSWCCEWLRGFLKLAKKSKCYLLPAEVPAAAYATYPDSGLHHPLKRTRTS